MGSAAQGCAWKRTSFKRSRAEDGAADVCARFQIHQVVPGLRVSHMGRFPLKYFSPCQPPHTSALFSSHPQPNTHSAE